MPTIQELRDRCTSLQSELLGKVVEAYLITRNGVLAIELHLEYIRAKRPKAEVIKALSDLGGSIVFEVNNHDPSSRYHPTFLGVLLAPKGPTYEALLVRYIEYAFKVAIEKGSSARITHTEIENALGLSRDESTLLFRLISVGQLWGVSSSSNPEAGTWDVGIFKDVDDVPSFPTVREYVQAEALKHYNSREPVFERDRQRQQPDADHSFSLADEAQEANPIESEIEERRPKQSPTEATVETLLVAVGELVPKSNAEIQTDVSNAKDWVLAHQTDGGLLRSPRSVNKVAEELQSMAENRADAILKTLKRVAQARRFARVDQNTVNAVLNWIMDDIGRIHAAGRLEINQLVKEVGFYDGLPPRLEDHYQKLRKRLATEVDIAMAEVSTAVSEASINENTMTKQSRRLSRRGSNGPFNATVFRVMIASPGDVQDERRIAQEVIADWNAVHSYDRRIVLMPLIWERDAAPLQGGRPQALINAQVLAKADILIAIFWSRIGSPTGLSLSGTIEELTEHVKSNKPAMLYFSESHLPHDADPEQLKLLKAFKSSTKEQGLYSAYTSPADFRNRISRDLAKIVIEHPMFAQAHADSDGAQIVLVPTLNQNALSLLNEAASGGGQILVTHDQDGGSVQVGEKNFVASGNARSLAEWEGALRDLVEHGFAEDVGNGELFKLTREGYIASDKLNGNEP